ncbi:marginal zone B- and B1-cell-specific protein-like [Stegodyphus dumicola]|uniref:marginal zone B- and B1-cell-specific protein-like n=1 Tax=Stegodyphus dumicola TaxID=202533 RepID=UPI0015B2FCC9|nr:marginal zone B- and B1-cell-specific protein-like [Stegodyphus dumicola]
MQTSIRISTIIFLFLLCSTTAENIDDPPGEKMSLSVPKLSEEETESNHMPNHLKCDACLAVAYQIQVGFKELKKKSPKVKESDVLDVLEQICNTGFNEYGVKQVDNMNRLSGPGLETEHVMGMTQMGGRWPHR